MWLKARHRDAFGGPPGWDAEVYVLQDADILDGYVFDVGVSTSIFGTWNIAPIVRRPRREDDVLLPAPPHDDNTVLVVPVRNKNDSWRGQVYGPDLTLHHHSYPGAGFQEEHLEATRPNEVLEEAYREAAEQRAARGAKRANVNPNAGLRLGHIEFY